MFISTKTLAQELRRHAKCLRREAGDAAVLAHQAALADALRGYQAIPSAPVLPRARVALAEAQRKLADREARDHQQRAEARKAAGRKKGGAATGKLQAKRRRQTVRQVIAAEDRLRKLGRKPTIDAVVTEAGVSPRTVRNVRADPQYLKKRKTGAKPARTRPNRFDPRKK